MKSTKAKWSSAPLLLVDAGPKTLTPFLPSAHEPAQPEYGRAPDGGPTQAQELVIDGRRYRLVPLDSDGPAPARRPTRAVLGRILTPREMQIVALVSEGRVNKQIAHDLGISEWTVSTHLRRIFAKLDVDTRAAMVTKCFEALTSSSVD
jgi:DNA-binding CsgD family transcriptional regulator